MLNLESIKEPYRTRLRKYLDKLTSLENVKAVVLFGSLAEGKVKPFPESDIDLLVIAENLAENPAERRMKLLPLKNGDTIFEDIWITQRELEESIRGGWGVILDALTFGIVLYDPQNIIKEAKEEIYKHYTRIGRIWKRK
ncbi:MAG: nucleotidyltransferase domain-containing protein [Nitrososphaerota archaeon]